MSITTAKSEERNLADSIIIDSSWVKDHLTEFEKDDPELRLIEVDHKSERYDNGHIPGAIKVDWDIDVKEDLGRNVLNREAFESIMGEHGITEDTTLVVYGDEGNWFAAHAFWVCRYFGHNEVRMLEGGRRHWTHEGYEFTNAEPKVTPTSYSADEPNEALKPYMIRSHP
jgi:thiosulfate/3-mercaptopyruvate sulfurtransferase